MNFLDEKLLRACLPISKSKLTNPDFVKSLSVTNGQKKRSFTEKSESTLNGQKTPKTVRNNKSPLKNCQNISK